MKRLNFVSCILLTAVACALLFARNTFTSQHDASVVVASHPAMPLEEEIAMLEAQLQALAGPSAAEPDRAAVETVKLRLNELYALRPENRREPNPLDQGSDNCPATVISSVPYTDSGTTFGRVNNFTPSCAPSSAPDVVYQFTPGTTGIYTVSLCGSSFDTILHIRYGGSCPGSSELACNDDTGPNCTGLQSSIETTFSSGITYYVIVDGYASSSGSYVLNVVPGQLFYSDLIFTEIMPNPGAVQDSMGEWFEVYNGTSYTLNLQGFILRDNFGSDTIEGTAYINSHDYFVFCTRADTAINGGVPTDYAYVYGISAHGLALSNTSDVVQILSPSGVLIDSVRYTSTWPFSAGISMQLRNVISNNDVDTNWCACPNLWPGSHGDHGTPGAPAFCVAPPGDNCSNAFVIPNLPFTVSGTTVGYTNDYDFACPYAGSTAPDAVYAYTPIETEMVSLSLCGGTTNFDTKLYIYQGSCVNPPIACNDDSCTAPNFPANPYVSRLECVPLTGGNTYYVVVDGYGALSGNYTLDMSVCAPCTCAVAEHEPNDNWPPIEILSLGLVSCGTISSPQDVDLWKFQPSSPTAVRITLTHEPGLHPAVEIFTEDSVSFASATDCTNVATEFTSDFKFGAYPYVFSIGGLNGTTGCYHIQVDPVQLPQVPPPSPVVTLYRVGNQVQIRWQASYFGGEQMRIEKAPSPDGPYSPVVTVPATQNSFLDGFTDILAFYRLEALGSRDRDPYVGSLMDLSQFTDTLGGTEDLSQFRVDEIEWAVTPSNDVVMSRLKARGGSPGDSQLVDQDIRSRYGIDLTPIQDFAGHNMAIYGRKVALQHVAFVHDPTTGEVNIADARGSDPGSDTIMVFGRYPQLFQPNNGGFGVFVDRVAGRAVIALCAQQCCHLKMSFLCQSAGIRPACDLTFPGSPFALCRCNRNLWAGCPCLPPPPPPLQDTLYCIRAPDTCVSCVGRVQFIGNYRVIWCMCPRDTVPPTTSFFQQPHPCVWQAYAKCGRSACSIPGCQTCPVCPILPGLAVGGGWVQIPLGFNYAALKAACKKDCTP